MQKSFSKTDCFEQLYKENYARLYYYAFRFVTDEEACKDIVNDVFEKAWQHFEDLKPETAAAYLYAQTRNRCIDYLRHRQVEEQYGFLSDCDRRGCRYCSRRNGRTSIAH